MELTPEKLFQILELTAIVVVCFAVYDHRHWLLSIGRVAWGRYVTPRTSSRTDTPGSETGLRLVVLPQQNQENQEPVLDVQGAIAYLARHNLTPDEAIDLLAILRWEDGDYLLSANKIRDVVGGADAVVKAQVASHRPKLPAKPSARLERPANGW